MQPPSLDCLKIAQYMIS